MNTKYIYSGFPFTIRIPLKRYKCLDLLVEIFNCKSLKETYKMKKLVAYFHLSVCL